MQKKDVDPPYIPPIEFGRKRETRQHLKVYLYTENYLTKVYSFLNIKLFNNNYLNNEQKLNNINELNKELKKGFFLTKTDS